MDKKIIITISREFGSGGHDIGRGVAERLGIDFYDREILAMAAENNAVQDVSSQLSGCFPLSST